MCVVCDLLCDAVWCVLVFVARVCVVLCGVLVVVVCECRGDGLC